MGDLTSNFELKPGFDYIKSPVKVIFSFLWLCELTKTSDVRQEKRDLKVFVVVMPKEGWARMATVAAPILLLAWHPTFQECNVWCQQSQILKSRCHTKRRMDAAMTTTKTLRSVFSWRMSSSFVCKSWCLMKPKTETVWELYQPDINSMLPVCFSCYVW